MQENPWSNLLRTRGPWPMNCKVSNALINGKPLLASALGSDTFSLAFIYWTRVPHISNVFKFDDNSIWWIGDARSSFPLFELSNSITKKKKETTAQSMFHLSASYGLMCKDSACLSNWMHLKEEVKSKRQTMLGKVSQTDLPCRN